MSLWSRIANVFRAGSPEPRDRRRACNRTSPKPSSRAAIQQRHAARFGRAAQHQQQSRDVHVIAWLDSLRADLIFGWRQL